MASRGHQFAGMDFDDTNFQTRPYDRGIAHGQSKTANALFAVALDARGAAHGVRAFSLHPGGVITDLTKFPTAEELRASGFVDAGRQPVIDPERNMRGQPGMPITDIAFHCGFDCSQYFSAVFSKHFKTSPGSFRKGR